ncbi:hypothetical protein IFO69_20725 [Echinicola sp. CAU 1574]|uniref:Viral A-type inclusion protein n=1 Tax=Echinicola arenosa TaxID=2774144 RepID=A0ABR9AQY2_9BACT|nr:hypothetical protein [Echinicola arenosa]MBD8491190.1 hypothetical protein [Echinicola arenosa]
MSIYSNLNLFKDFKTMWLKANKLLLLCVVIMMASCESDKKSREKMIEEVMIIHDEVMPKMGKIKSAQKRLLQEAEILEREDSVAKSSKVKELRMIAGQLGDAYDGMFDWMHQYPKSFDDMAEDEVFKVLEEQKVKITKVNKDIKEALKQLDDLEE